MVLGNTNGLVKLGLVIVDFVILLKASFRMKHYLGIPFCERNGQCLVHL